MRTPRLLLGWPLLLMLIGAIPVIWFTEDAGWATERDRAQLLLRVVWGCVVLASIFVPIVCRLLTQAVSEKPAMSPEEYKLTMRKLLGVAEPPGGRRELPAVLNRHELDHPTS